MPLLRKDAKTWAQTRINLVMERGWDPVKMEDARKKRRAPEKGRRMRFFNEKNEKKRRNETWQFSTHMWPR